MKRSRGEQHPAWEPLRAFRSSRPRPALRIVFTQGHRDEILATAVVLARDGLIHPVVIGDSAAVRARARRLGWGIAGVEVIAAADTRYLRVWQEERSARGISEREAAEELTDPANFARAMALRGEADAIVTGPGPEARQRGRPGGATFLLGSARREVGVALGAAPDGAGVPSAMELAACARSLEEDGERIAGAAPEIVFLAGRVPVSLERRFRYRTAREELEWRVGAAVATLGARTPGLRVDGRLHVGLTDLPVRKAGGWRGFVLTESGAGAEIPRALDAIWCVGPVSTPSRPRWCALSEGQTPEERQMAVIFTALCCGGGSIPDPGGWVRRAEPGATGAS